MLPLGALHFKEDCRAVSFWHGACIALLPANTDISELISHAKTSAAGLRKKAKKKAHLTSMHLAVAICSVVKTK